MPPQALSAGAHLGAYEIQAAVGAGGMGEVYRARDPRLGRQIAIKVLPAAATSDPDRRARFEREARAVAALNHPNIVTIYGVEEASGTPFFTMEYVEGRTLAQLIPPRGLPLDELLAIAIPLADAVAAAHERGILHRDLKPANVMVTGAGRVKVLDFGLAKLQDAMLEADDGAGPTAEATGEGRVLGTVAYMSPEQAEGKELDQRSDVFSLGILLYEMATGQRPFKGETNVSIISAILKDAPGSVTDLRPDLPRDLAKILRRSLTKDPERRYQSVKDLRNDLETLKEDLDSGEILRAPGGAAGTAAPRRKRLMTAAVVPAILGLTAVGGWWASRLARPTEPASSARRPFDDSTLKRLTTEPLSGTAVAVSPDGRYVAYAAMHDGLESLCVRQADTPAMVQVVPPADVQYYDVSFSADGNRLYYVAYPRGSGQAALMEVPVLGGTPRRLIDNVDRGVSFSPDGGRLAFVRGFPTEGSSIVLAAADGTDEHTLVNRKIPNDFLLTNIAWSADGQTLASAAYEGSKVALVMVDVATGTVRPVGSKRWDSVASIAWPRNESHLYIAAADYTIADTPQVWEVTLPAGGVRRITKDVAAYTRLSVSADARTLVTVRSESRGTIWVGPSSQPDRVAKVTSPADTIVSGTSVGPIRWTPSGEILFTADVSGNIDIWSVRPDGSNLRQLTTSPGLDAQPTVTPDGRYVAFVSDRSGQWRVWRMSPDGRGQAMVTSGSADNNPLAAPDSRNVYFLRLDQRDGGVRRAALENDASVSPAGPWEGVPASFTPRALSQDATLILGSYWDAEKNRTRMAVAPADGKGRARTLEIPVSLGQSIVLCAWAPGGRAVTFVKTTDGAPNLWRLPLDGGPAAPLTHFTSRDAILSHAWSTDGKMLALVRGAAERQLVVIREAAGRQ